MKLGQWMQTKGLTEAAFAAKVGVSQATINRIRRGVNFPAWPLAMAIAVVTEGRVKPNDFLPDDYVEQVERRSAA
jgi:DNA-binding XRE family transcriptional regulator